MIIFVGKMDQGYFVEEYASRSNAKFKCIPENGDIKKQTNAILNTKGCQYMIFDVEQYINSSDIIAEEIYRISKVNNAKPIIYASGYLSTSEIVIECLKRQITNFIFATSPGKKNDQLEKCINGYYDVNGMEEISNIIITDEEEEINEIKKVFNFKSIAVVGTINRIGTTTQAIQILKCLLLNGYKACYVEMGNTGYVENLATFYESEVDEDLGKVTFENTDMYFKSEKIAEILKLGYDYYIYDYGKFEDTNFNKISFLEKDLKIIVCGVKPNEMAATTEIIGNTFYSDASYIFSFVPESEQKEILELMEDKANLSYFSQYAPDPFTYCNSDIYQKILRVENKNSDNIKSKGRFFWRKRK